MFIWHSKLFLMQLLHFSFSFLVICLDTCTIKCPHTEAVLLFTATFQTTDEQLLTMCFGTTPRKRKQSWSFFLLNLRQALLHYCSEVRDCQTARFFVNDRHKGLLTVLPFHFSVSKHLYRVVNTFFKSVSFEDDI